MDFKNPYLLAVTVQCLFAGMNILTKAAYEQGMNISIFVFYRLLFATLSLVPFAIAFEWKSFHSLDLRTFFKIFGIALVGAFSSNSYGLGLKFTTSTAGAATQNCMPVMTIVFAIILRTEKVNLRKRMGIAKVVGMIMCLGGVVVLAFYDGSPQLKSPTFKYHLFNFSRKTRHVSSAVTWLKGCLLLMTGNAAWSLGLVLQGKVLEKYPSKLTFTALLCFLSATQSFFVAIARERDPSQWKLALNFKLLVVIYCGVFATGLLYYLQALVINSKGPVFLAMLTPLNLMFTMMCSMFLLGEAITLASILGGIMLGASLYIVLLAKKFEEEERQTTAKEQVKLMPVLKLETNEETRV